MIVRHEHETDAEPPLQRLELDLHFLAELSIESAERLIEQEDSRLEDDGASDRDALLLAAGKLCRIPTAHLRQTHELERRAHSRRELASSEPLSPKAEANVAGNGEMREQGVLLKDGVDVSAMRGRIGDVGVAEHHGSRVRALEARDNAKKCGLSAPGRTEQRDELSLGDVERNPIDCGHLTEAFDDLAKRDGGCVHFDPKLLVEPLQELGDVVVFERLSDDRVDEVLLALGSRYGHAVPGDKNDLRLGVMRAQMPSDGPSVHLRHREVGEDDVERITSVRRFDSVGTALHLNHAMTLLVEDVREDLANHFFVVDDEHVERPDRNVLRRRNALRS